MPFEQGTFYKWTGTSGSETSTKLSSKTSIWEGWLDPPVAEFTSGLVADANSNEMIISLELPYLTNIDSARITKIHGTFKENIALNAGVQASYTGSPKAKTTPSTVATLPIVSDLKATTLLEAAWSSGLSSYAFLHLQHELTATAPVYNPAQMEGNSGYPLIQVAFSRESKDPLGVAFPGGLAPESVYNRTGTMIFILDDNDEMQMLGCFQNEVNWNGSVEWTQQTKGATQGVQSWALNNRSYMLSGSIMSMNGGVLTEMFHMQNRGSDGRHTEYASNSAWAPVKTRTVYFLTYSDEGREFLLKFPKAAMRITGDVNMGADNTVAPFEIQGTSSNLYISDNLYDVHYFATDYTIA